MSQTETGGANAANAQYVINYLLGTSSAAPPGATFQIPSAVPFGVVSNVLAPNVEQAVNPQATLQSISVGPVQAFYDGSELRYFATISDTVSIPLALLSVPNRGMGGVVGFVKISEDNNPMPRDRFIFNYDYFDAVPLTPNGIPVNRYQFGFEKTFFDGRTSIEVRMPFASTLNSDGFVGADGTNTELGNLRLALKALLLRRQTFNVSTGLGIYLPTADDFRIRQVGGPDAIRVTNESVQLSPFLAALWTPTNRFFSQAWLGFAFDTGGNKVTVDPNFFGGTRSNIGQLRSASLMTADMQLGYWLYLAESGLLRGAAPFLELHYNGSVSNGTVLTAASNVFIGDTGGNFDELNLSTGVTTKLGNNVNFTVGVAAPLRSERNRTFDYQVGVRLNWFFGYTAQRMTPATNVSTFGP